MYKLKLWEKLLIIFAAFPAILISPIFVGIYCFYLGLEQNESIIWLLFGVGALVSLGFVNVILLIHFFPILFGG